MCRYLLLHSPITFVCLGVGLPYCHTWCYTPYLLLPCAGSSAGNVSTCEVVVTNTGNVRIENVNVTGDDNTCSKSLMAPSELFVCSMSRTMMQSDFEAGKFLLTADGVTGAARGPTPLPVTANDSAQVATPGLNQTPLLDVEVTTNITQVHKAGKGRTQVESVLIHL